MRFGPVPLDQAAGAVLAHTQRLPGRVLKKGTVLDASAVDALRAAGHGPVIAAQLDPGDVGEDEAATRLAAALTGPGITALRGSTGRVNLAAAHPGLLRVDVPRLDALNGVDEALTVATAPDWAAVVARDMLATVKVIPFAVPGALLAQAESLAAAGPVLRLHPFQPKRVGLVMTTLPGLKPSILVGTAEATANRVRSLGGTLLPPVECPHDTPAIAGALRSLMAQGADILLVAGASAVVDRRDVGPAGIVDAGGEILHFGMPVDPGNLICLGAIGARPALVLPGCARSPKLNGIDWVLARLFAGLPVDSVAVSRMGAGGLLQEGARPMPRAEASAPAQPGVAAVVLAAGRSSRMAPHHKLLLPGADGTPMVARVVDHVLQSAARPVVVVTGHRADEVRAALSGRDVRFAHAADYANGLSASLRVGLAAVPPEASGALVCLGDMPLVTGAVMDRLIASFNPAEGRAVVVPTFAAKAGNPVLWGRQFFPEMARLSGDVGARKLLDQHAEFVERVEVEEDSVLRDFDTVESLAGL